jgi:hypothetical protein
MRAHEASQQQRELRKIRMTYEILARNELNAKLAEINTFLEDRAAAQVPILPKVTSIGLQIFVTWSFYIFVTCNDNSLEGQVFCNHFGPIC